MNEEHYHFMELLGAFLTGVVGPILYLLVSKYLQKEKDKKRDKVKENISSVSLISDELEFGLLSFIMVVTSIPQVNQYKNSLYFMK